MGLTVWPKEIVQNQYASLLLETGAVGVVLLIVTLWMVVRRVMKPRMAPAVLTMMVSFGVSLLFFSGLANALHIYLLTILMVLL